MTYYKYNTGRWAGKLDYYKSLRMFELLTDYIKQEKKK